jgi:hypothetical protein
MRCPARYHIQDRLVAGAEAPTIDDRSPTQALEALNVENLGQRDKP